MRKQISERELRDAGKAKVAELVSEVARVKPYLFAFAEWRTGEVFVGKSGVYRYRHSKKALQETPWSEAVGKTFASHDAFVFAATLLDPKPLLKTTRPNVVDMAKAKPEAKPQPKPQQQNGSKPAQPEKKAA